MGGVGSGGHNIKAPGDRVNRSRGKDHLRVVTNKKATQPELDKSMTWPARTREWWKMWGDSPLTTDFTAEDWSELHDTALLHAEVWTPGMQGSPSWFKAMAQLRQRTANFGATPLDRQRLRIQFSFAEEAEDKAEAASERRQARAAQSARSRRGGLKAQSNAS